MSNKQSIDIDIDGYWIMPAEVDPDVEKMVFARKVIMVSNDPRFDANGKPVAGAEFSTAEMSAMYGDAFMDDFFEQANGLLKNEDK